MIGRVNIGGEYSFGDKVWISDCTDIEQDVLFNEITLKEDSTVSCSDKFIAVGKANNIYVYDINFNLIYSFSTPTKYMYNVIFCIDNEGNVYYFVESSNNHDGYLYKQNKSGQVYMIAVTLPDAYSYSYYYLNAGKCIISKSENRICLALTYFRSNDSSSMHYTVVLDTSNASVKYSVQTSGNNADAVYGLSIDNNNNIYIHFSSKKCIVVNCTNDTTTQITYDASVKTFFDDNYSYLVSKDKITCNRKTDNTTVYEKSISLSGAIDYLSEYYRGKNSVLCCLIVTTTGNVYCYKLGDGSLVLATALKSTATSTGFITTWQKSVFNKNFIIIGGKVYTEFLELK